MNRFSVYSFSYKNPDRHARMTERFRKLDVPLNWVPYVQHDDPRIVSSQDARIQSIMYGHIDMLKKFLDSSADYGVFCEDDVYIHKDFTALLSQAIEAYDRLELNILLLGYLLPYKPFTYTLHPSHSILSQPISVMGYNDDLWGAQMYMCNKRSAQKIVNAFAHPSMTEIPFVADFCITKFGKRAFIYPMLAVEEGSIQMECVTQSDFHEHCSQTHYDPAVYL